MLIKLIVIFICHLCMASAIYGGFEMLANPNFYRLGFMTYLFTAVAALMLFAPLALLIHVIKGGLS